MTSYLLGTLLKDNLMEGRPSRMKDYEDYTGLVIPPCGEFAPKTSKIEPPPWMPAQPTIGFPQRLSLHREIEHFMAYMKPTNEEVVLRKDLVSRLTKLIRKLAPDATLRLVGSSSTGLNFPTSDIEMEITFGDGPGEAGDGLAHFSQRDALERLEVGILHSRSRFAKRVESFLAGPVPLLRVTDAVTGIEIDLSASEGRRLREAGTVCWWMQGSDFAVIRSLVMVVRLFLSIRRLGSAYSGGVDSYLLVWMVIAYVKLDMAPGSGSQVSGREGVNVGVMSAMSMASSGSTGTSSSGSGSGQAAGEPVDLGAALLGFLRFYGLEFDYMNWGIVFSPSSVRLTTKPPMGQDPGYMLYMTDPADPKCQLGAKAYSIKHVRETFRDAYVSLLASVEGTATRDELVRVMFEGALGSFLGGDYLRFVAKRKGIVGRWRSQVRY